jgi:RimJ/RimL family protein N-acetyltransferase
VKLFQDDAKAKEIIDAALHVSVAAPFVGLVALDGESAVGAVIINNYETHSSVDVSFTGRLSPTTLRDLARYLFNTLAVRRVQAVTRKDNLKAREGLKRLGFQREGILRQRFEDCDGMVYGLLRSDCKFWF